MGRSREGAAEVTHVARAAEGVYYNTHQDERIGMNGVPMDP